MPEAASPCHPHCTSCGGLGECAWHANWAVQEVGGAGTPRGQTLWSRPENKFRGDPQDLETKEAHLVLLFRRVVPESPRKAGFGEKAKEKSGSRKSCFLPGKSLIMANDGTNFLRLNFLT